MNIAGISGASGVDAVSQVSSGRAKRTSSVPPPQAGASAAISKPGELMSKLQLLQKDDPAKFKAVAAQLSKDLKTAAGSATGQAAEALNKLADGLAQASSSGDLTALAPPKGAHGAHHGHHHHGGGGGAAGGIGAALSSAVATVDQALGGGAAAPAAQTASAATTTATK